MGKAMSLLKRPVRRFNVENRASAVLAKEKPTPAPDFEATKKQRELARSLRPNFLEEHNKKDEALDDRLKQVYVSSPQEAPVEASPATTKQMPYSRFTPEDFKYGFYEPDVVPEGKCTLGRALKFISKHSENPAENSAEAIAAQYKMDKRLVENILKHFKPLVFHKVARPKEDEKLNFRKLLNLGSNKEEEETKKSQQQLKPE